MTLPTVPLIDEECPFGGSHVFTSPQLWEGTSCRRCHKTWEGRDRVSTWPAAISGPIPTPDEGGE